MFQNKNHRDRPKAIVKYSFQALIENHDKTVLKYKQMIVLHEPPVAFNAAASAQQKVGITTCCCCDKGHAALNVLFNKNVFYSNESATADVSVDNHECKLKITEVEFEVQQKLLIHGFHRW